MKYTANEKRYDNMPYRRCGESGLKLPAVSLGLWHNFGDNADYNNMCQMCFTAFDNGILTAFARIAHCRKALNQK